jgi:hypothetical protein
MQRKQAAMQQPPQDLATLLFRMSTMDKDITALQAQLGSYEPSREADLKLQRINDALGRLSTELIKITDYVSAEFAKINTRLDTQDKEAKQRDDATKESQSKFQIKMLWFFATTVIGIGAGIVVIVGGRLFTP